MSFCFSQDLQEETCGHSDSQQSLTDSLPPTQPFSQDSGFRSQRPPEGRTLARPPSCPDFGREGGVGPGVKKWMFSMSDKKVVGEELGLQLRQISSQVSRLPRHVSRMLEEAVQFLEKLSLGRVSLSESDWGSVKEVIDQLKQNVTEDDKICEEISDKIVVIFKLVESVCAGDCGKGNISDECITQLLKEVQNQNLALKKVLEELKEIQSNMTSVSLEKSSVLVTEKSLHSSLSASSGVLRSAVMADNRLLRTDNMVPRRTDNRLLRTDNRFLMTDNRPQVVVRNDPRVEGYLQQPVSTSPPAQLVPTASQIVYRRPKLTPKPLEYGRLPCYTVPGIKAFRQVPDMQILEMDSDSD